MGEGSAVGDGVGDAALPGVACTVGSAGTCVAVAACVGALVGVGVAAGELPAHAVSKRRMAIQLIHTVVLVIGLFPSICARGPSGRESSLHVVSNSTISPDEAGV